MTEGIIVARQFIATIEQQAKAAIADFGGVRAAARILEIDPGYLSRLASGKKSNPSVKVLDKLGLAEPIYYTQAAVFTACHRCEVVLLEYCQCNSDRQGQKR